LFSGYAGQLADGYSKRTILVVTKCLEVAVMAVGMIALAAGHLEAAAVVVFLIGAPLDVLQPGEVRNSARDAPGRGAVARNGLLEMSTFVAIVIGTAAGGFLFDLWRDQLWLIGGVALTLAVVGMLASFRIRRVAAAARARRSTAIRSARSRRRGPAVARPRAVADGDRLSYFWFFGALLQQLVLLFGTHTMGLDARWVGVLMTFAADRHWSWEHGGRRSVGDKVELGLVPIGAFGMGLFSLCWRRRADIVRGASVCLMLIGFSAGLFAVPLNAMLQQRPDRPKRAVCSRRTAS
jgi:acyl-[acyl-carrier-protein]-phospholipid O-acyltransferase/long-chain-fatty-acid--[acyl-carrier-protein] ligase